MRSNSEIVQDSYSIIRKKAKFFFKDNSLCDDLANEVSLILLEMDNEKINEIEDMDSYVFILMRRQVWGNAPEFKKHYEIKGVELDVDENREIETISERLRKLTDLEKRILSFIAAGYSASGISRETGIYRKRIKIISDRIRTKLRSNL